MLQLVLLMSLAVQAQPLQNAVPSPLPPGPQVQQIPSSPGLSQPDYRLGPGDTLRVTVWTGAEYLDQNITLAADGTILIPFFVNKIVKVADMTAVEVRDLIRREMQAVFRDPVVQVLTVTFESKKAMLVGELRNVGYFSIFSGSRVLEFILRNGGTTDKSNLVEVQLTRASGEKLRINLYDVVTGGDPSQNVFLMPDDIVYVPSIDTISNKYFILGEVQRPGMIQSSERLSLLEVIARAGTLAATGRDSEVLVVRAKAGDQADVTKVAFRDIYRKGDLSPNIALNSGDIIFVPRRPILRVNEVVATLNPLMGFIRDTILFTDLVRRKNNP